MDTNTFKRFYCCLILVFILCCFPPNGYGDDTFGKIYYKFDRWVTNFDPIGKTLTPINENPKLKISGLFYQWSFFNTHFDKTVGYVEKDWRAQEIQFLGELHTRYQISPRATLVNKLHYHYDGVYDWQISSLYADQVDANAERTNTWNQFVRELYLDMEVGNWYMKIGKQQVAWGKMEGRWMDFINNLDRKDGLQVRAFYYNELRIPLWMSNFTYTFGAQSLQLLWIPDYEPDMNPYAGSVWYSPLRTDYRTSPLYRGEAKAPGSGFKNHQWAIRYDTKINRYTWSIGYMYGFSPSATGFIRTDDAGQLYLDSEYTRRHYFGTALDFAYLIKFFPYVKRIPLVIRTEIVYKTKHYLYDSLKWDAANGILISGDGVTDRNSLSGAIQLKFYFPGKTAFTYQPMFNYYEGWRSSLGTNQWSVNHLLMLSKFFKATEDRLNACLYLFLYTGGPINQWQGVKTQFILTYKFSDYMEGKLSFLDFNGSEMDAYGRYDNWDNVGWEFIYKF